MAKKQEPDRNEERELDKAYWELTGYKFRTEKKKPSLFLMLLVIAAILVAFWAFGLPGLLDDAPTTPPTQITDTPS